MGEPEVKWSGDRRPMEQGKQRTVRREDPGTGSGSGPKAQMPPMGACVSTEIKSTRRTLSGFKDQIARGRRKRSGLQQGDPRRQGRWRSPGPGNPRRPGNSVHLLQPGVERIVLEGGAAVLRLNHSARPRPTQSAAAPPPYYCPRGRRAARGSALQGGQQLAGKGRTLCGQNGASRHLRQRGPQPLGTPG